MKIRKAEAADYPAVAAMTAQLFEDEQSDGRLTAEGYMERLERGLAAGGEAYLFLADAQECAGEDGAAGSGENGGGIAGYAFVNLARTPYYLVDFFICRECRKQKMGTKAFHLLLEALGTQTLDLDVYCWNSRGRGFWQSLGFEERAVIMRRQG